MLQNERQFSCLFQLCLRCFPQNIVALRAVLFKTRLPLGIKDPNKKGCNINILSDSSNNSVTQIIFVLLNMFPFIVGKYINDSNVEFESNGRRFQKDP